MSSDPNEFLSDQTLKKWRELVGNGRELLEQEFKVNSVCSVNKKHYYSIRYEFRIFVNTIRVVRKSAPTQKIVAKTVMHSFIHVRWSDSDLLMSIKKLNEFHLLFQDDEEFCRVRLNEEFHKQYRTNNDYINASKVRRFLPVCWYSRKINQS